MVRAAGTAATSGDHGGAIVVADHLNNPRGLDLRQGSLYVAEAGRGGDTCIGETPEEQLCVGLTTAVVDIAFGPDGSLYASEFTTDAATFSPVGAVVRVRPNGHRTVLGTDVLHYPGGVAVDRHGKVYVANWSILPAGGAPGFPADARGQVVRLSR